MNQFPAFKAFLILFLSTNISSAALAQFVQFDDPKLETFFSNNARTTVAGEKIRVDANGNGKIEISEAEFL